MQPSVNFIVSRSSGTAYFGKDPLRNKISASVGGKYTEMPIRASVGKQAIYFKVSRGSIGWAESVKWRTNYPGLGSPGYRGNQGAVAAFQRVGEPRDMTAQTVESGANA